MTIAVLSWGAQQTLIQSLTSYRDLGLDVLDDERLIYFQQISEDDIKIAQTFGYKWIGSIDNVGIAEGYKTLVEEATGEYFLFLENDWLLIEDPLIVLKEAEYFLETTIIDVVKLRHRATPGGPLWSRQYEGNELEHPEFLLDSIHWTEPDKFEQVRKVKHTSGSSWYLTSSKYANWSNNPHFVRTKWAKDIIVPRISGDIERNLQSWWQEQNFQVLQGEGLFQHNRID